MYIYAIISESQKAVYVGQSIGDYTVGDFGKLTSGVRLCDHFSDFYRGKEKNADLANVLADNSFKDLTIHVYPQGSGDDSPYGIPAKVYEKFLSFFIPSNRAARKSTNRANHIVKIDIDSQGKKTLVATKQTLNKNVSRTEAPQQEVSEFDILDIAEIIYTVNFINQGYTSLASTVGGQSMGWYYKNSLSQTYAFSRNTSGEEGLKVFKYTSQQDAQIQKDADLIISQAMNKINWNNVWNHLPAKAKLSNLHEIVYSTLVSAVLNDPAMQVARASLANLLTNKYKLNLSGNSILDTSNNLLYDFLKTTIKRNRSKQGPIKFKGGQGNVVSFPVNLIFDLSKANPKKTWWQISLMNAYRVGETEKFQAMQTIFLRLFKTCKGNLETAPVSDVGVANVNFRGRRLYKLENLQQSITEAKKRKPPRKLVVKELYFIADKSKTKSMQLRKKFMERVNFDFIHRHWRRFYNSMWYHINRGTWQEIYPGDKETPTALKKKEKKKEVILTNTAFKSIKNRMIDVRGKMAYRYNLALIKKEDLKKAKYY